MHGQNHIKIIINVHRSPCQLFYKQFCQTCIFLTDFRKILIYKIPWNPSSGIRNFHADRRADMTNLIVSFRLKTSRTTFLHDFQRLSFVISLPTPNSLCSWESQHFCPGCKPNDIDDKLLSFFLNTLRTGAFKLFKCMFRGSKQFNQLL